MTNRNSAQKTKCGALTPKAARPYLRHCVRAVTMSWLSLLLPCMGAFGTLGCSGGNSDVAVTGVTLDKTTMTLKVGETGSLTATVLPENASNKALTWNSDNTAVVTVSNRMVRAVGEGEAKITVTTQDGNKTATCVVTVSVPATGISLNKDAASIAVGGTETLTAIFTPSNATNKNVTWLSSNTAIATVTGNGLNATVNAIASGTATITATTQDGSNRTATCAVTVYVPDPNDTPFALINALDAFCARIRDKVFTDAEQAALSDELKKIFVAAYARDTYSANLPFTSEEIRKGLAVERYIFPYSSEVTHDSVITLGTKRVYGGGIIHETGHHWGSGEPLAQLLMYRYMGMGVAAQDVGAGLENLEYSPFYLNLLSGKVGDKAIWSLLRSQNPEVDYEKLWNENMTVTIDGQKSPLVSAHDFGVAQKLSWAAMKRNSGVSAAEQIIGGYEKFSGVQDLSKEFGKIGPIYESALKTNNLAEIKQVRDLFKSILDYKETDVQIETARLSQWLGSNRAILNEYVRSHLAAVNAKDKSKQGGVELDACGK